MIPIKNKLYFRVYNQGYSGLKPPSERFFKEVSSSIRSVTAGFVFITDNDLFSIDLRTFKFKVTEKGAFQIEWKAKINQVEEITERLTLVKKTGESEIKIASFVFGSKVQEELEITPHRIENLNDGSVSSGDNKKGIAFKAPFLYQRVKGGVYLLVCFCVGVVYCASSKVDLSVWEEHPYVVLAYGDRLFLSL
ncbi:MAG: hypothetical protein ACPGC9_00470 [Cytophagales bacterium]